MILEKMYHGGAIFETCSDAAKPAGCFKSVKCHESFVEEHHDTPAITMSMGKDGVISRLCGEVFGSCVTFGSHVRKRPHRTDADG